MESGIIATESRIPSSYIPNYLQSPWDLDHLAMRTHLEIQTMSPELGGSPWPRESIPGDLEGVDPPHQIESSSDVSGSEQDLTATVGKLDILLRDHGAAFGYQRSFGSRSMSGYHP